MQKIRINREKWMRGGGDGKLWSNTLERGCCLGHAIRQLEKCGREVLNNLSVPSDIYLGFGVFTDECGLDNDFSNEAIRINDDSDLSEHQREVKLIELFAQNNLKLEFYDLHS